MKSGFWLQLVLLGLLDVGTLHSLAQGHGGPRHIALFALVNVGLVYAMGRIWRWIAKGPPPRLRLPRAEPSPRAPSAVDRRLPWFGVGAFLLTCALLLSTSAPVAEASLPDPVARVDGEGSWVVQIDARDRSAWVPFSLELGRVVPDGPAADLLLRRTALRAPRGAGGSDGRWHHDLPHGNPVFERWYRFDLSAGGLVSRRESYRVRLAEGVALLRIEGYHCPDGAMGCLSLRYELPAVVSP